MNLAETQLTKAKSSYKALSLAYAPAYREVHERKFKPYNDAQLGFMDTDKRIAILSGAVRAGKSLPLVWRIYLEADRYPGGRFAVFRKYRSSLKETTLRSFLVDVCGWDNTESPGSSTMLAYWSKAELKGILHNGSEIMFFGLDKAAGSMQPQKKGSLELTKAAIDEAIELDEADFDMVSTRLSYQVHGSTPQLFMATNPGAPTHWIHRRFIKNTPDNAFVGFLKTFDNPHLTEEYRLMMQDIPQESNFYKRMVLGQWIGFLGVIHEPFNPDIHVVDHVPPLSGGAFNFRSIDFGGSNPHSCSWYRYFPPSHKHSDTLYHYRQVYWSEISASELGKKILAVQPSDEPIRYTVSDHDKAQRLELASMGITTRLAKKDVNSGLFAVNKRLASRKLLFKHDALVEVDPKLITTDSIAKRVRPTCLLDEIPLYEWGVTSAGVPTDAPVKRDDHACNELRYATMSLEDHAAFARIVDMGRPRGF